MDIEEFVGGWGNSSTRCMIALCYLYETNKWCSARTVAKLAGLSLSTTHKHLDRLRRAGIIEWPASGALKPTYARVGVL